MQQELLTCSKVASAAPTNTLVSSIAATRASTCHSVDWSYRSARENISKSHCVISGKIASRTQKAFMRLKFENHAHIAWHTSRGIVALALEDELRAWTHPRQYVDLQMTSLRACAPCSVSIVLPFSKRVFCFLSRQLKGIQSSSGNSRSKQQNTCCWGRSLRKNYLVRPCR